MGIVDGREIWVYVALCSWEECIFVSIVNDNDFLRNCEAHALSKRHRLVLSNHL